MTVLKFIDETLRDGPQSLWATRMRAETMLEAAPLLDAQDFPGPQSCLVRRSKPQ